MSFSNNLTLISTQTRLPHLTTNSHTDQRSDGILIASLPYFTDSIEPCEIQTLLIRDKSVPIPFLKHSRLLESKPISYFSKTHYQKPFFISSLFALITIGRSHLIYHRSHTNTDPHMTNWHKNTTHTHNKTYNTTNTLLLESHRLSSDVIHFSDHTIEPNQTITNP